MSACPKVLDLRIGSIHLRKDKLSNLGKSLLLSTIKELYADSRELVFITGASAFGEMSIFLDLNNLYNISLTDLAEELLGITQEELESYFEEPLRRDKGRCDALVQTDDFIYAFEFKLDGSAEKALQQIREKANLAPYADSPKEKIAVGVNFSSEERRVVEWKAEAPAP